VTQFHQRWIPLRAPVHHALLKVVAKAAVYFKPIEMDRTRSPLSCQSQFAPCSRRLLLRPKQLRDLRQREMRERIGAIDEDHQGKVFVTNIQRSGHDIYSERRV